MFILSVLEDQTFLICSSKYKLAILNAETVIA